MYALILFYALAGNSFAVKVGEYNTMRSCVEQGIKSGNGVLADTDMEKVPRSFAYRCIPVGNG